MTYFFLIASAILVTIHSYLFWKLRQWLGGGFWQLPVLLFFAFMLCILVFRRNSFFAELPPYFINISYAWLGFTVLAFGVFILLDGSRILLYLFRLFSGADATGLLAPAHAVPMALVLSACLAVYAFYSAHNPQVNRLEIKTSKLPDGIERLRIVAASDIHLGGSIGPEELAKTAALISGQNPDIIAFTGDLVDTDMNGRGKDSSILRELHATYGKYAVMGNHEVYRGINNSRSFMKKSGLELLENRAVLNDSGIIIVGIDDPAMPFNPKFPADPVPLLKKQDQNKFILLLKHRPLVKSEEIGLFDLQLSGHTHGGQIWPGTMLVRKFNDNVRQGLTRLESARGQSLLHVSNGVGYWGPPMRFLAPPEITVIDLVRQ